MNFTSTKIEIASFSDYYKPNWLDPMSALPLTGYNRDCVFLRLLQTKLTGSYECITLNWLQ